MDPSGQIIIHIDLSYNSYEFVKNYFDQKKTCCAKYCNNKDEINKNIERIIKLVYKNIRLEESDKEILLIRYISIIKKIEGKYRKHSKYYTMSTLFTNISSILVTAFISINNLKETTSSITSIIWWLAWTLSLGISLVNTIGAFYKWDRKYLLMFKVFNRIEQEIWMYLELVGPYSSKTESANEHKNKLGLFLAKLELIYKRVNDNLIDIEENDQDDKDALKNNRGATASELPLLDINSETNQNNSIAPESKKNETSNNFIKLSTKKTDKDPMRKNTLSILKEDNIPNLSEEEGKLTVTAKKDEDANKYKEEL
jgi:hypothetical protein